MIKNDEVLRRMERAGFADSPPQAPQNAETTQRRRESLRRDYREKNCRLGNLFDILSR
jgi:hypothetical protein